MDEKRPEYPWQIPSAPGLPGAGLSEAERRGKDCDFYFEIELEMREQGFPSDLVHDPEAGVFRFPDGRFALSREHADWAGLKSIGYFAERGM